MTVAVQSRADIVANGPEQGFLSMACSIQLSCFARQVTIEEIEPTSEDQRRELPSFGSGIEFRPQHRNNSNVGEHLGRETSGVNAPRTPDGAAAPGLSFLQDDPMDAEDAGGTANVQLGGSGGSDQAMPKAPRQRNYRGRH
jgi:hypothetical protein